MLAQEDERCGLVTKVIPLKLFLDMVARSYAENVTMRVAWMFLWKMNMCLKLLGLSMLAKSEST